MSAFDQPSSARITIEWINGSRSTALSKRDSRTELLLAASRSDETPMVSLPELVSALNEEPTPTGSYVLRDMRARSPA